MIGGMVGGVLTDKFGRKRIALFGLLSSGAFSLVFMFITDINTLYYLVGFMGLLGSLGGPARQAMLADILPTVGGVMQIFNPPETPAATTAGVTLPATPRLTIPTLPLVVPAAGQQPQAKVFTTTAPAAAKPDYLPFIVIGAIILLMFTGKK